MKALLNINIFVKFDNMFKDNNAKFFGKAGPPM